MDFKFKVIAKSFPAICLVAGLALVVASCGFGLMNAAALWLGVVLIFSGIGLYVLYLFLNRG